MYLKYLLLLYVPRRYLHYLLQEKTCSAYHILYLFYTQLTLKKFIYLFQLMKGTFYHCLGAPYVVNRSQCEGSPGEWVNHQYNFDNLPKVRAVLYFQYVCLSINLSGKILPT